MIYFKNGNLAEVSILDTEGILCYDFCMFEYINAVMKRVRFWKFYRESLVAEKGRRNRMEDGFGAVC